MDKRYTTFEEFDFALQDVTDKITANIGDEITSRGYRIANELHDSLNMVMRGNRHGRRYKVPGTYRNQRETIALQSPKGWKTVRIKTVTYRNGVYYTASAAGEVPAIRTGAFRMSWRNKTFTEMGNDTPQDRIVHGLIESNTRSGNYLLGELLEYGTKKMRARPYKQRTLDAALPKIRKILKRPYLC